MVTWCTIQGDIGAVIEKALDTAYNYEGHEFIQFEHAKFKRDKLGFPYMIGQYGVQSGVYVDRIGDAEKVYPTWSSNPYNVYAALMRPSEIMQV
jgi:hypothetical protein